MREFMYLFVGDWIGSSSGKGKIGKRSVYWKSGVWKMGSGKDKCVGGTGLEWSDGCV